MKRLGASGESGKLPQCSEKNSDGVVRWRNGIRSFRRMLKNSPFSLRQAQGERDRG